VSGVRRVYTRRWMVLWGDILSALSQSTEGAGIKCPQGREAISDMSEVHAVLRDLKG